MGDRVTPKSKIARLKRDIADIDQQMVQTTTDRPAPLPRGATERKAEQKKDRPTGRGEDDRREVDAAYHQRRQHLISLLSSEKSTQSSLQSKLEDARRRLETFPVKLEAQNRMTIAKRKRDSQLLDKQVAQISQQRSALFALVATGKALLALREEGRVMCCEEVRGWERLHEEFVAEREEAEELLADFQRNHPTKDASDLLQALYVRQIQARSEGKTHALRRKVESAEAELASVTKNCFFLASERQKTIAKLGTLADFRSDSSIKSLESRIASEWEDLDDVISTMNRDTGFDIDEQILRAQVLVVDERLKALEKEYTLDSTDLEERILDSQDEAEILPSPRSGSKSSRLRAEAESLQRTQLNRIAAIAEWKRTAASYLRRPTAGTPLAVSDDLIVDEIRMRLKKEKRTALEKTVCEYVLALKSKEERLQSSEYSSLRARLCEIDSGLRTATDRKLALQLERGRARADLKEVALQMRKGQGLALDESHALLPTAKLLVSRVVHWEGQAEDATARIKSLLCLYRELDSLSQEEKYRLATLTHDFDCSEASLKTSQSHLRTLSDASSGELVSVAEATGKIKAEIAELSDATADATAKVEAYEAELSQMEEERRMLAAEERQRLKRGGLAASRSDFELPQLEETPEDCEVSRGVREHSDSRAAPMEASNRPSSELYGTHRSRSLLRSSVTRMPSRSPLDSREEELEALFDLDDDDFDLLQASPCETPPRRSLPEGLSQSDREFFEKVLPLLEGGELFKKYSKTNSLKQKAFDPLLGKESAPELCGFGLRTFKLRRSLQDIEIKQGLKGVVESTIALDQVQAPMIPQPTMAVLKTQKRLIRRKPPSKSHIENLVLRYKEMKDGGFVNVNSPIYEEMCRDCFFYPFSIVLKHSGRVEVVAYTYYWFKTWVNGLNALLKRRNELGELSARIPVARRWV